MSEICGLDLSEYNLKDFRPYFQTELGRVHLKWLRKRNWTKRLTKPYWTLQWRTTETVVKQAECLAILKSLLFARVHHCVSSFWKQERPSRVKSDDSNMIPSRAQKQATQLFIFCIWVEFSMTILSGTNGACIVHILQYTTYNSDIFPWNPWTFRKSTEMSAFRKLSPNMISSRYLQS